MTSNNLIPELQRSLTSTELDAIPWLRLLTPFQRERTVDDLKAGELVLGDYICRSGHAVTHWLGVAEGLLKMSKITAPGKTLTFAGIPSGGWFGEGTALKRETYRYDIQALRKSRLIGLHVDRFHWLLDHSLAFNRFIMCQLNERIGQFIMALEIDRLDSPDTRVARSLASLFHPVLYPGVGKGLRITQQELALLVGLSRQRVNEALSALAQQGAIKVEYGGLRVLDMNILRNTLFSKKLIAGSSDEEN